jgi:hypothetical protein
MLTCRRIAYMLVLLTKMHALAGKSLGLISLFLCCLSLKPDALDLAPPSGRMRSLPARTLWVWERRENLCSLDTRTTAIATLDRTILLGRTVTVIPRRQPILYPSGITRIAVIRIEAPGEIGAGLERATAASILDAVTADPTIAALQIDFDARHSQRTFYIRLLRDLRRSMPPALPLSITALASWCSYDDWLSGLPIDEAVPMFFRMEPDRRLAPPNLPQLRIREPLCSTSIGISTHERHAESLTGKRLYIFPDRGWHEDLPLLSESSTTQRIHP